MSYVTGYVVTLTEHTPTRDGTDINTYHIITESFLDALKILENAELNFTVFINVSITTLRK